jgi:hypothetical protein
MRGGLSVNPEPKHSTFNIQPEKCAVGVANWHKRVGGIGVFELFTICQ